MTRSRSRLISIAISSARAPDIPYVSHVLAVASIVLEAGGDEDEAIAALLHDAVEDAPKELGPSAGAFVRKWIGLKFGSCVQAIVDACTDADTRDESGKKLDWTVRKTAYIDAIAHKAAAACLVSAGDKVHNARAILRDFNADREHVWERFNKEAGGRDAIVGYYRGLADALSARAGQLEDRRVSTVVRNLAETVEELERAVEFKGVWPPRTSTG